MTAYIGAENLFEKAGAVITDNWPAPVGFELENAYDWKTHTSIKAVSTASHRISIDFGVGNAETADYLAVIGHNLSDTTSRLWLLHSDDEISYTNIIDTTPGDNTVIFEKTTYSTAHRYWQVRIDTPNTDTIISHISFGTALQLRPIGQGFKPPVYQKYRSLNSSGINANYLGRSVYRDTLDINIKQTGITPADFRTDFVPMLEHITIKPFFFTWDYENYPSEAVYCWLDKRSPDPVYSHLCHMAVDIKAKGLLE